MKIRSKQLKLNKKRFFKFRQGQGFVYWGFFQIFITFQVQKGEIGVWRHCVLINLENSVQSNIQYTHCIISTICKMSTKRDDIVLPVFDGSDYKLWKQRMTVLIKYKRCVQPIECQMVNNDSATTWLDMNIKAVNYLQSVIK